MLHRLALDVPEAAADAAAAAAVALGAQGVAIDDADTGAPPGRAIVQSWHPPETEADALVAAARRALAAVADARITVTAEADTWRAALDPAPLAVAGFTVGPAVEPGPRALCLDPASAFGGDHPTTVGCLEALVTIAARAPIARALDVGTGTGILALALARLGAAAVVATDIDPLARAAARRHAEANGLAGHITVQTELPPPAPPFELVVANLYLGPLLALLPALAARLAPGGRLVLSGIATGHRAALDAALAALPGAPLTGEDALERDGWLVLVVASAALP